MQMKRRASHAAGSTTPATVCGPCVRVTADERQAELFRALADPNRIALLARLADCGRPCTVSEIACCLPIDLSVVSRHLRQLREAGILHAERRGKEVHYEVRYDELVRTLRELADAVEACCPIETSKRPNV
jgi:ArsR family transcriptional regulator, arsenate/arsenite/antimonite-responsive transcriptional repressor